MKSLYIVQRKQKIYYINLNMALNIELWLIILSNSITLPTNIICDMIDNPDDEINQDFFRTLYSRCIRYQRPLRGLIE